MDNSDYSRNSRNNEHLGVNKLGKNIRKSPLHQPNFGNNSKQQQQQQQQQQQPQPHVYNISKNDFRNIVQQLTGSPSQNLPPPRPPQNPPKPQSLRLQKIRPPPLTPMNRPPHIAPPPVVAPAPPPFNSNFVRSAPYGQQSALSPLPRGDSTWANIAESPISAYMRYLQNSMTDPSPRQPLAQPHHLPQSQAQPPPHYSGLLPTPPGNAPFPSPRGNAPPPFPSPRGYGPPPFPSPRGNGPPPFPSPRGYGPPPFPSPRGHGPPLLPSPTSQFGMPSPGFFNIPSPRSPYPLLSPGFQYPSPLTPNFFSSFSQSGVLGPGPQTPNSPGILFPPSPGFFPMLSPRWRD